MSGGWLHVTLNPFHKLAEREMKDLTSAAEEVAALRDAQMRSSP